MSLRTDYSRHEYIYSANPESTGWNHPAVDREILSYTRELLEKAGLSPPASIMEIGCGMGNLTIPLAVEGFQVEGIDISPTAISAARRRLILAGSKARFRMGDVTRAESYNHSDRFDGVLDGLCWHCIIGEDRKTLLKHVRNILKPKGSFLIMTMCGDPRQSSLLAHFDVESRCLIDGYVAERYLGLPGTLLGEVSEAGFEVAYCRVADGDVNTGDQDMLLAVAINS